MIVYNHDEIFIKHYLSILYMDENRMTIKMDGYNLFITGNHLVMVYYDNNELKIQGKLKVIECYENRI